ncbi:MAG: Carbonic anhydrase, alpha class [Nitrospira sp.]|jgi:carbonic anhydrase|nr:MAG: Carbonic anhydrase, alpha class [Nitrospira sp.]
MIKHAVRAYYFAVSLMGLLFSTTAATEEKPAGDRDKIDTTPQDGRLRSHWGYMGIEGPTHWAMLSPQYMTCEAGSKQSPINIHAPHHSNTQETLAFDYKPTPVHVANNGHTIQVDYKSYSVLHVNDRTYRLRQFHFHDPSEHEIEGIHYPMELHLVHQDSRGHIVVVSVFLELGAANPWIADIWNWMPETTTDMSTPLFINVAEILPSNTHHYTYKGSLTTPPCTEGVQWILLEQPVQISADQQKRFADIIGENARPVQPAHERNVEEY